MVNDPVDRFALQLAILEALDQRPQDHRYERVAVAGYEREDIDAVTEWLFNAGLVRAWRIGGVFGDNRPYYKPSVLTDAGRAYLAAAREHEELS